MEASYTESEQHLSVVGQDLEEMPASLAQQYGDKAKRLDLSYNRIRDLSALGSFLSLDSLVLDYNNIEDDPVLPSIPSLRTLSLNSNNIENLEVFLPLVSKAFPSLTFLSLLKNPACPNELTGKDQDDYRRYRIFVVFRIPTLKFLDSSPVTDWERNEAKRVGHLTGIVVRPKEEAYKQTPEPDPEAENIKALPDELRSLEKTGGASFTKTKYVYVGRQSEGNRFILNEDL